MVKFGYKGDGVDVSAAVAVGSQGCLAALVLLVQRQVFLAINFLNTMVPVSRASQNLQPADTADK